MTVEQKIYEVLGDKEKLLKTILIEPGQTLTTPITVVEQIHDPNTHETEEIEIPISVIAGCEQNDQSGSIFVDNPITHKFEERVFSGEENPHFHIKLPEGRGL